MSCQCQVGECSVCSEESHFARSCTTSLVNALGVVRVHPQYIYLSARLIVQSYRTKPVCPINIPYGKAQMLLENRVSPCTNVHPSLFLYIRLPLAHTAGWGIFSRNPSSCINSGYINLADKDFNRGGSSRARQRYSARDVSEFSSLP